MAALVLRMDIGQPPRRLDAHDAVVRVDEVDVTLCVNHNARPWVREGCICRKEAERN